MVVRVAVKARIVTTHYRYKPPPPLKKGRKLAKISGPAIARKRDSLPREKPKPEPAPPPPANDDRKPPPPGARKPAIVTARRPGARHADVPDLTPEEHQRRADAAAALFRELVRRAGGNDR
jgi:hypothetical protein